MSREYHILWYRFHHTDSYLIWYSNEKDGVLMDGKGSVPSFASQQELLRYAESRGISIEKSEPELHDLDLLDRWLKEGNVELIECNQFNSIWNLFADISESISGDFDSDKKLTEKIYDKLFRGCNLPSVTPEGKWYRPEWPESELRLMQRIFKTGMEMFERSVKHYGTDSMKG